MTHDYNDNDSGTGDERSLEDRLADAIRADDAREAERLLVAGADANASIDRDSGERFLHLAVIEDKDRDRPPVMTDLLLNHGAYIDELDAKGVSPLALAIDVKSQDVALRLIERGADLEASSVPSVELLRRACERGSDDVALALIRAGAEIEPPTGRLAPLHCARSPKVAEALIAAGADANARTSQNDTPLHGVAYRGDADVARVLLDNGADPSIRNKQQNTPLHLARGDEMKAMLESSLSRVRGRETAPSL